MKNHREVLFLLGLLAGVLLLVHPLGWLGTVAVIGGMVIVGAKEEMGRMRAREAALTLLGKHVRGN